MNKKTAMPDQEFWKRKLSAYLHDPPDKCFDIAKHEELADSYFTAAGLIDAEERRSLLKSVKSTDHFASAAERFVFPKRKCATNFTGKSGACFIHPLSSAEFAPGRDITQKAGKFHEILADALGGIQSDDYHKKFFLFWRRWMENAVTNNERDADNLALLPADTRIPDHSIWNHISLASALTACQDKDANGATKVKPTLLLFQLGPVQEFIEQARSTRDLWSGSYMLSWLMGHAMKAVSDEIGPDSIIFPSLRGNGIFDALHKDSMYSTCWDDAEGATMSTWERMIGEKNNIETGRGARWLLTPTLPNRFLALVPESRAVELAEKAELAIVAELRCIGDAVWDWIKSEAAQAGCSPDDVSNWHERWNFQLERFPKSAWAVQRWLDRGECLAEFAKLPVNKETDGNSPDSLRPIDNLNSLLALAENDLPVEARDSRYYSDEAKTKLKDSGILWSAHYALVDAKLAARRNTRDFNAWNDPTVNRESNGVPKDSLSGVEEIIGTEDFWNHLREKHPDLFKTSGHMYGAINLIKRLWCRDNVVPYLRGKLGVTAGEFNSTLAFDSVEDIAKGNEFGGPYVAVLAMDGDQMGKWVSGENAPRFLDQLSMNARKYLEPILRKKGKEELKRLLTPSYHLQFSEALANFATWIVEAVVREHRGQLIYAGGDDVLAMLPSDRAIACAEALRAVFRGEAPPKHSKYHLAITNPGFVLESARYPLMVPGAKTDVSAGIAVGHKNAPLQMLVREARSAEKRAKDDYDRGALAISVYKRSGEITQWGCKWDDYDDGRVALKLMRKITELSPKKVQNSDGGWNTLPGKISGRFPYALAELLAPYAFTGSLPPDMRGVVAGEFAHVLERQGAGLSKDELQEFTELAEGYLNQTAGRIEDFVNIFLVETFINRFRGGE